MSEFIKHLFCEEYSGKEILEKMPSISELEMSSYGIELQNIPKQLIGYNFKAMWRMNASGTADEYDKVHKVAIQALTRAIYEKFYQKLTYLELALYDHDVEKAKEIMQDIKKEVGI